MGLYKHNSYSGSVSFSPKGISEHFVSSCLGFVRTLCLSYFTVERNMFTLNSWIVLSKSTLFSFVKKPLASEGKYFMTKCFNGTILSHLF